MYFKNILEGIYFLEYFGVWSFKFFAGHVRGQSLEEYHWIIAVDDLSQEILKLAGIRRLVQNTDTTITVTWVLNLHEN